jgi:hypothetical protein
MSNYPKGSGALFANDKRQTDKHPELKGVIEVTNEQIHKLIEMSKAGLEPKLQVAAWWRNAKQTGAQYLSMSTEAYMPDSEPNYSQDQYRGQAPAPQQGYQPPPQQGYRPPQNGGQPPQQNRQPPPQQGYMPPQQFDEFADDDLPFE